MDETLPELPGRVRRNVLHFVTKRVSLSSSFLIRVALLGTERSEGGKHICQNTGGKTVRYQNQKYGAIEC